jgi:hypothetical protein
MVVVKDALRNQVLAALSTLRQCLDNCPDSEWDKGHNDAPFSQVAFHALFYTDFYLGRGELGFKDQEYHKTHPSLFSDYEELEDRQPVHLYLKAQLYEYLSFCAAKVAKSLDSEDDATLSGDSGFPHRRLSRLELYIYLIRHIQHHAAQLGLRVQTLTGRELSWVSSGWEEGGS